MSLFKYTDYRKCLTHCVKVRQQTQSQLSFQSLAEGARVSKSYLSKVLTGKANLSADQLFLIVRQLQLTEDEMEYMELLLEKERCGVKQRENIFEEKIARLREKHLQTRPYLKDDHVTLDLEDQQHYYLSPWTAVVHMGLTIPKFARDPLLLASSLRLDVETLELSLCSLARLGLVERTVRGIKVLKTSTYLSRASPLYPAWRTQICLLGLNRCAQYNKEGSLGLSATFSSNQRMRQEFQRRMLELIAEIQNLSEEGPFENLYQFNVDLFPWTSTGE